MTSSQYFTKNNIPNVRVEYRSIKGCKKNCTYPVIVNHNGMIIKAYSRNSTVSIQASGRYEGIAYLQYRHSYPCGDKRCSKKYLLDDSARNYPVLNGVGNPYDAVISRDRVLYEINRSGIYASGEKKVAVSQPIETAKLNNNAKGDIAAVAVDVQGSVYASNTVDWHKSSIQLSAHGDRSDILAVYPQR